jgi:hypothetical protein
LAIKKDQCNGREPAPPHRQKAKRVDKKQKQKAKTKSKAKANKKQKQKAKR